MSANSSRAIIAAFIANLGIAVAKFAAFLVTGAASMLAESVHSLADTSNQGLLLLGRKRAARPADDAHPFGHGRERFFWSFVVAIVLFTAGALFALFEGEEKLRRPHELESAGWAIGVLIFAILLEGGSLLTARKESLKEKGEATWWQFVRRSKSPELPVVLLEDVGALLGLGFALTGVLVAEITGNPRWDALGSIAIGALLGVIAMVLAAEMKSLLMGESASPADARAIREALEATPGIARVLQLRTQHLGPEELLVVGKISFDDGVDIVRASAVIDQAESGIRARVPGARLIYLEPDVDRGPDAGAGGKEAGATPSN